MKRTKQNGITLIALVITIIVLLILAAVSIATLTGENGILTRANDAKEQTEIADEKEAIQLAYAGAVAEKRGNGDVTASDLNREFVTNGRTDANASGENPITVTFDSGRSYTVDSNGNIIEKGTGEETGATTIGEVYDDSMIGQKVTYTSNGQSEWIVFGKDTDGNVLLTTKSPIANGFNLTAGPESWLNYEEDLKQACSGYGGTIKDRQVTSRSITMEDINYVSGFDVNSLNFDTYTFGTEQNYENKKVNYYFPSLEASSNGYWQQPSSTNSTTFPNNWYYYYQDGDSILYGYSGGDDLDATSMVNADRFKYIIGEDGSYEYLVASPSVRVDSNNAYFIVADVGDGGVGAGSYRLCYSDSDEGYGYGDRGSLGIRPIVVLPSDIEVEKNESGQWDIAY